MLQIPPKFYLNENIPIRLVKLLSDIGITAIHTIEVKNQGNSDENQLQYASDRGYIVVTHNRRHFKRLHRDWITKQKVHSGILVMSCGEPEYLRDRIKRFIDFHYLIIQKPFCVSPPR